MNKMVSVEDALDLIGAHRPEQETVSVALADAMGARLANPLVSRVTRPPASVSAMDGYAVRLEDAREPGAMLKVIGQAPAGTPFDQTVAPGEAVRIFTGGEVPAGADHIIIQENVSREHDQIRIVTPSPQSRYIRKAGIDFSENETVIAAGCRLGPAEIAVAAAANHDTLQVKRPLRVAILANGDELKPPGSALTRGQIVNSNPQGLAAMVSQWGGVAEDLGIAADSVADIQSLIAQATEADIIVPVGGASVGDHDHMRAAFAGLGYEPVFEKIAVKPGKPTWFSKKGAQCVLGLPGNPASALVCAHLFLRPLLGGIDTPALVSASLQHDLPANGPRETYLRATAGLNDEARLIVRAHDNQDSSLLTPFLEANCFIRREANARAAIVGQIIKIKPIGPLAG